jgi:hypothetical protein
MSDGLKIFNSILKTNLNKSDRFSNFKFTNSRMFGDGFGVSLAYSNETDTVTVNLYDKEINNIPDCSTNKENIQSEILMNEFNVNNKGIENFLETQGAEILAQGAEILDFGEIKALEYNLPMIVNTILFVRNGRCQFAQLYLTSINNNFLKFRLTFDLLSTESNEDVLKRIREKFLEKRPIIEIFLNDFTSLF